MAAKAEKEKEREEKLLREQRIAMKRSTMSFNKPQRPQSGVQPRQRPGTATVAKRTSSAVPEVKSQAYVDYDKFKKCFEMDVVFTIAKDIEEVA